MEADIYQAAVAGLLHDIGKVAQRAGREGEHAEIGGMILETDFKTLWLPGWPENICDAVTYHHAGETEKAVVKAVRIANWLASAKPNEGHSSEGAVQPTPLTPITARVELDRSGTEPNWALPLKALSIHYSESDEDGNRYPPIFPRQNLAVDTTEYAMLWDAFSREMNNMPGPINSYARFNGLLSILRQYTTQIPSVTDWKNDELERTGLDVSLYDHLKVTAAIAPCLLRLPETHPDHLAELHAQGRQGVSADQRPVAELFRADFSGIQRFIYRIVTPASERTHQATAKRLRGRSFYIALLAEVVVDWFLREMGLTAANALFVGGGRFDLLLPLNQETKTRLERLIELLQDWLLENFYGALGIEVAYEPVTPADFQNLQRANDALDAKLAEAKHRKFGQYVKREGFFTEEIFDQGTPQVCRVCGLTPLPKGGPESQTCALCDLHKNIGQHLPRARYIARLYNPGKLALPMLNEQKIDFDAPIDISFILLKDESEIKHLLDAVDQAGVETIVYGLNDAPWPDLHWPDKTTSAQFYLANAAPQASGQVYEFDKIAEMSAGTKRLGILKADVDHLGLIFSLGLAPPTISRVAALSHTFDRFFSGYLNTLCQTVTETWKTTLLPEREQALQKAGINVAELSSLFYIVYAGGDDLLIIGPWDQTVELAGRLYDDFRAYTCRNPDLTLSAGISLVKPHFPVQRFVELVSEALEKSKHAGRDRLTVFEEAPVLWASDGAATAFDSLLVLAHDLLAKVESSDIPRTLIHDMERVRRIELKTPQGDLKPMVTPKLLYLLTRRLSKTVRDDFKKRILDAWPGIRIPLTYVGLITRKE